MATAIFRPASLAVVLMLRLANEAALSSTITWSILGTICALPAMSRNLRKIGSAWKAI
jgi:hypothetical protein